MGQGTGDGIALRVVSYNIHTQRDDTAALAAVVRDASWTIDPRAGELVLHR